MMLTAVAHLPAIGDKTGQTQNIVYTTRYGTSCPWFALRALEVIELSRYTLIGPNCAVAPCLHCFPPLVSP